MPSIRVSICTAFLTSPTEPYIFLVDEAHNLPDRARSMYSAELDKKTVLHLQRAETAFACAGEKAERHQ
jgi:Rad3-related DNA helicase